MNTGKRQKVIFFKLPLPLVPLKFILLIPDTLYNFPTDWFIQYKYVNLPADYQLF